MPLCSIIAQEEEPDTPPPPSALMLLTDHSGQPTKSRNLAEKMEQTRLQLKALVYVRRVYSAPPGSHDARSDFQRALTVPVPADQVRDLEARQKGSLIRPP